MRDASIRMVRRYVMRRRGRDFELSRLEQRALLAASVGGATVPDLLADNSAQPANNLNVLGIVGATQRAAGGSVSVWTTSTTPNTQSVSDNAAVELGLKFRSSQPGNVTGLRFYKGNGNTGTHVGHLWTSTGGLLATVTFSGESFSGWQTATFSSPVAITANTTYIISYYAPTGHYSADSNYFNSATVNSPLTALASHSGQAAGKPPDPNHPRFPCPHSCHPRQTPTARPAPAPQPTATPRFAGRNSSLG